MTNLTKKKCHACTEGEPPLEGKELEKLKSELEEGWDLVNEHHIEKEYKFKDFKEGMKF